MYATCKKRVSNSLTSEQCALERGVPVLRPDWIYENYATWLKGDDVDVAAVCASSG